ncbi:ATPase [Peptoniphilus raoultii]|uniref:ATPase n=1 Tax=Peptoniphilus raoultii TaxID=1776387 RepID=UPI0008D9BEA1|nr:ATPase [Peptoniphilus raoultii]
MSLTDLVNEMEDLLETASQIPLTGKVMIDREEFMDVIKEIKAQMPGEISDAKKISEDKENIIAGAHDEADKILSQAKAHAEKVIDENELVIEAKNRADEILKRAHEESTQVREGARDYADNLLENTQVNLSEIIKMLNENRQELRG